MFKKVLCFVVFIMLSVMVYADFISFKASVDKKEVPLSESFIYSITLSGDGSKLPEHQISDLKDFTKFGISTSQNISVINGKTNVSVTYKYTLGPKKVGKFTIPPTKVTYNGKAYLTESIDIIIATAQSSQKLPYKKNNQFNPPGKAFVKASANKRTIYENEKLIYKFSFYTNVDLVSNPEYFAPNFTGFWNDGSKPKNRFEIVGGVNYRVDEIETVLYPIEVGLKTIQSAKIKITTMDLSSSDDMDDFFSLFSSMSHRKSRVLETSPVNVNVVALPKTNRPIGFSGSVGDFKISASVDKKHVQISDPITLTVKVSGNGNMKSVTSVNFNSYEGFKKYETVVSNDLENVKEFKTIFVPLAAGSQEIPQASLSFFNPAKKKYEVVKTFAEKVEIYGESAVTEKYESTNSVDTVVHQDISYNKQVNSVNLDKGYLLQNFKVYLVFVPVVILLIFCLCYRVYKNICRDDLNFKKNYLHDVLELTKDAESEIARGCYKQALYTANKAYIKLLYYYIKQDSQQLPKEMLINELKKLKLSDTLLDKILRTLEEFSFYQYSSVDIKKDDVYKLIDNIKSIMSYIK